LQNGAGVHVRDRNNDTPLMCAVEFGHEDVVKALVECGAHIQVTVRSSLRLCKVTALDPILRYLKHFKA
jgi:ankyrin repeat protein